MKNQHWSKPFEIGQTVYIRNRSGKVKSKGLVTETKYGRVKVEAEESFYTDIFWDHKSKGMHSSNFITTFITHSDEEHIASPHGP